MFFVVLKPTKLQLILRCKKKVILLRFYSQQVQKISLLELHCALLLMTKQIFLLLKITSQIQHKQPQLLLQLLRLLQPQLKLLQQHLKLLLQLHRPHLLLSQQEEECLLVLLLKTQQIQQELILQVLRELDQEAELLKLILMMLFLQSHKNL